MDEDGIGLVLARASELRSKLTNCIHKASTLHTEHNEPQQKQENGGEDGAVGKADQEEEEEETESLLNIRDALESLEAQLSSLQALQQQQWYEREAALAEIDYSRKKLLKKLKDYKGEDFEVIHEATAFASEAAEDNNDLLLPPYPSRPPCSLVSDNGYLSHFPATHKSLQNGIISGDPTIEAKSLHESERNQVQSGSRKSSKGLRFFINAAAKTVLTLLGVVSVLSLAGFEPRIRRRDTQFNVLSLFQHKKTEANKGAVQCPPGKVPVVEDGEIRCLVKERFEIPFESFVATPNVNYGCG